MQESSDAENYQKTKDAHEEKKSELKKAKDALQKSEEKGNNLVKEISLKNEKISIA